VATGCAQQRQAEARAAAEAQWEQAEADCTARFPPVVGNYLTRARCFEPALRKLNAARGVPGDLGDLLIAQRMMYAGKIDRQEVTPEEGDLRYAEVRSRINDRAMRRRNEALAASPPPYIPPAPVVIQQPAPAYALPRQTSCTRIGNTVDCSSY
jgi:hypothetical protein